MKRARLLSGWAVAALAAVSLALSAPARATTVDTTPFINATIGSMGAGGVDLFGQTFQAPDPADTVLNSFGFSLQLLNGTHPFDFRFRVMSWNGDRAEGEPLYQSDLISAQTGGWYTFDTGSLSLAYGSPYVAFVEYAHDGSPGIANLAGSTGNHYPGGQFVYLTHSTGFSSQPAYTAQPWVTGVTQDTDVVFRADFSSPLAAPPAASASLVPTVIPTDLNGAPDPNAPPRAPTDLTAAIVPALGGAPAQVSLTWSDDPSPNQKALAIWRMAGTGTWQRVGVVGPHATSFADATIRPGASYIYHVCATTDTLGSGWSNPVSVTLPAAPAAPTGLTAATVSAGEIDLTWTSGAGNETGISIFRKTGSGDWQRIAVVSPKVTSYRDRSVQPGTSYLYRVRTHNDHFASGWTSVVSVSTPAAP